MPREQEAEIWELLHEDYNFGPGYRGNARVEIVNLVDRAPKKVIDVGCGTGVTGALLKDKFKDAVVIGVEPHKQSAAQARGRVDRVLAAKLEDIDFAREGIESASVDLVLAADVLEHMYNPWQALRLLRPLLVPDATLIASLPNVRNLALLEDVADRGRWRYAPYGLLDVTHVRFFTRHDMLVLFAESGYRVRRVLFKLDPQLEGLFMANRDNPTVTLERGRLRLADVTQDELKELCSIQIILVATPE